MSFFGFEIAQTAGLEEPKVVGCRGKWFGWTKEDKMVLVGQDGHILFAPCTCTVMPWILRYRAK
jgi:hypothetical protein